MNPTISIPLTILTIFIAVIIALLLRGWLIRRLKKTVLDNWLIQIFGALIMLPPLIVAAVIAPYIITGNFMPITNVWDVLINEKAQSHGIVGTALNIIISVLIFALGIGAARTLMKVTLQNLGERVLDINIRVLVGRILYVIALTIAIFWVLTLWNIQLGLPVALVGALLTLAIQDILKDLVAGLYILMERPFHIGDQINTSNYTGVVEDVQLRATKLRLLSGEEVIIPNTLVFSGIVVNNTHYSERRATIVLTLAQDDFTKDETPEQVLKILKDIDVVLPKPEPTITLSGFTGTVSGYTAGAGAYTGKTVSLNVHFWVSSRQTFAVTEVLYALKNALPQADLAVREPAGDV
jgi:small-conductance mechanosensitive channel